MLRALVIVSLIQLGACAPPWFSDGSNAAGCPRDSVPTGSCTSEGVACTYVENTGNSRRAPLYTYCTCTAAAWACTVTYGPPPSANADAGRD